MAKQKNHPRICNSSQKNQFPTAEEVESEVTEEEEEEEPREKTKWELEEERQQAEIDAWRDRLIAEGQLVDSKIPQGKANLLEIAFLLRAEYNSTNDNV